MNKYEIILDVCETHSISRTAEKLNYTQSAISQAIRSYEKEQPAAMPEHLEAGTLNVHGIAGLLGALEYLEKTGIEMI